MFLFTTTYLKLEACKRPHFETRPGPQLKYENPAQPGPGPEFLIVNSVIYKIYQKKVSTKIYLLKKNYTNLFAIKRIYLLKKLSMNLFIKTIISEFIY